MDETTTDGDLPVPGRTRATPAIPLSDLYRSRRQRLVAGVAGGLGERFGIDPVLVRIAFVMLALSGFAGVVLYAVLWAILPEAPEPSPPPLPPGLQRAAAMGLMLLGSMILLRSVGLWMGDATVSSVALAALGAAVIWIQNPDQARDRLAQVGERLSGPVPDDAADRQGRMRLGVGAVFIAGGVVLFLQRADVFDAAPGIALAVTATMAGLGIIFGPWSMRLLRQLSEERRERIRSEERSEMAAHLHDSVLQTLALIQRTDEPREMVALARNQERELRSWLNGTPVSQIQTLGKAAADMASAVELAFKVPVELVTVGDAEIDDRLQALIDACREAVVNAAKHSGASRVSVYLEVEPDIISAFVRDEGSGFDPAAVAPDRRGIAESIVARLERCGGSASVTSRQGAGTEVHLSLGRSR